MDTGRRAYDILRGYVNQEWERIRGVDDKDAESELNAAMVTAKLRANRNEQPEPEPIVDDPQEWAHRILGVAPTADFAEVRKSFERLNSRADPSKFPVGSPEARQASEIQQRIQRAYAILAEGVDTTEKRFKSLEID
jgi:DnaJ-domain-containing protein 1